MRPPDVVTVAETGSVARSGRGRSFRWSCLGTRPAGAWQFVDPSNDRFVTVAFVDGDLWQASAALGPTVVEHGTPEWAGPLERVDAFRWDWFATLTPQ